jgi:hypothetical protein
MGRPYPTFMEQVTAPNTFSKDQFIADSQMSAIGCKLKFSTPFNYLRFATKSER